jgi:hypothetical protein
VAITGELWVRGLGSASRNSVRANAKNAAF